LAVRRRIAGVNHAAHLSTCLAVHQWV
jgi:hypothetical protein